MKLFAFIYCSLLAQLSLFAQQEYIFSDPVPTDARLFKINDRIILIHSMDINNEAQKWVCFDSSLAIVSAKKLLTPDAEFLIAQTYIESSKNIIRIDQLLMGAGLQVNAYTFDPEGNITHRKEINESLDTLKKTPPVPFYISQSPGKSLVAIVQTLIAKGDSLLVSGVVIDERLNIKTRINFIVGFDPEFSEMYMPIIDDNGNLFLIIADKFNSYKLSSTANCYLLRPQIEKPVSITFDFDRKKIKNLTANTANDTLFFSALYSDKKNKSEVAGILHAGYDLNKSKQLPVKEYIYSLDFTKQLKKTFGSEGHKGNILNYISQLPGFSGRKFNYAFLTHAVNIKPEKTAKKEIEYQQGMENLPRYNSEINSMVGTQPPGYSKPMTLAEASAYVELKHAMSQNNNNSNANWLKTFGPNNSNNKEKMLSRNLLFFTNPDSVTENVFRFVKIKPAEDASYNFHALIAYKNTCGLMYYYTPTFGQPYLKKTTIDYSGYINEKKVFESKNQILLSGYPFVVHNEHIYAFYQDKFTEQTGLIKIRL